MSLTGLYSRFNQALSWNAFLYIIHKVTSTIFTFFLYRTLTAADFATFASLTSIIFLMLLWADGGLRKAIPRYCPLFARNTQALSRFIKFLSVTQAALLLVMLPITYVTASFIIKTSNNPLFMPCLYIALALFLVEGAISLLRLIFHAYFWHKTFNLMASTLLLVETACTVLLMTTHFPSHLLIVAIFTLKLCCAIILASTATYKMSALYRYTKKHYAQQDTYEVDYVSLRWSFIQHAMIMWASTLLKSLSERNFLVPLMTATLGPTTAALFKVANEGSLLFQRIIIKTIGTSDTALLSHMIDDPDKKNEVSDIFQKITTKIAALCIPLLALFGLVLVIGYYQGLVYNIVFQLFFIITTAHLIESMFSTYERVLEVERHYKTIICAYVPYVSAVLIIVCASYSSFIGLATFILSIYAVRLVSLYIMARKATQLYHLSYPFTHLIPLLKKWTVFFLLMASLICIHSSSPSSLFNSLMGYILRLKKS